MGGILARTGRLGDTAALIVRRVPPPVLPRWTGAAGPVVRREELADVRRAAEAPPVEDATCAATEEAGGSDALPSDGWFVVALERPGEKAAREVVGVGEGLTATGAVGDAGAGAGHRGGSVREADDAGRPLQRGSGAAMGARGHGSRREEDAPRRTDGPVERRERAAGPTAAVTWRGSGMADSREATQRTGQDQGAAPDWRDSRCSSGVEAEVRVGRGRRGLFDDEGDMRLELSR